jgi:two-component system sensor histidine kinase KdpD
LKLTAERMLRYAGALAIVAAASLLADLFSRITGTSRLTAIFLSAVLIAAFYLGSGAGYLAAAAALVAHLYLVDPPYEFSLGSIDEMNALLVFLASSVLTCLLAGRVREERTAAHERERANAALLEATREFSDTDDEGYIRERLAHRLHDLAGGPALLKDGARSDSVPLGQAGPEAHHWAAEAEWAVRAGVHGTQAWDGWTFRPLLAGEQAFGVAGWRAARGHPLAREEQAALELLVDTGAAAMARARLAGEKADAETRARTEDLRNALLSSISHDLRTPLAAILGAATSLQRFGDDFDAGTRNDLAATIAEEAARLEAFVANLLQMSRLQSGAVPLARSPFSLAEAAQATVARRVRGRGTPVAVEAEAGLPEAMGDPTLFDQALGNVVENALRYAGDGPIRIGLTQDAESLRIDVEDRGPGVPPEDVERIFEKFYRSTAAEKVGGTGLGLAITRGLMEGMGGTAAARLRTGGGLAVTLRLPAARP